MLHRHHVVAFLCGTSPRTLQMPLELLARAPGPDKAARLTMLRIIAALKRASVFSG